MSSPSMSLRTSLAVLALTLTMPALGAAKAAAAADRAPEPIATGEPTPLGDEHYRSATPAGYTYGTPIAPHDAVRPQHHSHASGAPQNGLRAHAAR